MVKVSKTWDDEHIEKVMDAEKTLGKLICGGKIPKPELDEGELISGFKKRLDEWAKMPFCEESPVSENGRCERHGGLSTGAGKRIGQIKKSHEAKSLMKSELFDGDKNLSLIPRPTQTALITDINVAEDPYHLGMQVLDQLRLKGHVIPELVEPALQVCQSCIIINQCEYAHGLGGKCQYERRIIVETFGNIFKDNPNADPYLVYELAINRAELIRTRIAMGMYGIEQSTKKKINQEKKNLSSMVLSYSREVSQSSVPKISAMAGGGNALINMLLDGDVELIERRAVIKKKKKKEKITEVEVVVDE